MTTFDIVIFLGGICGICMVVGGMVLLYKGVISLNSAGQAEALNLEFKKLIRISTHYPALGLFVIGLAFILMSTELAKPTQNHYMITGKISPASGIEDPNSLSVMVGAPSIWWGKAYANDQIMASVNPTIDVLEVTISAPGYTGTTTAIQTKASKLGNLSIGEIKLTKVVDKPPFDPANIAPIEKPLTSLTRGKGL